MIYDGLTSDLDNENVMVWQSDQRLWGDPKEHRQVEKAFYDWL